MLLPHARYLVAIADQAISRAARHCMSRSPPVAADQAVRGHAARAARAAVLVPLEFAPPDRTAVLLQRKGSYRTAAARAFVALALDTDWDA
jgi:LysR family cyn operon transcriptional activator